MSRTQGSTRSDGELYAVEQDCASADDRRRIREQHSRDIVRRIQEWALRQERAAHQQRPPASRRYQENEPTQRTGAPARAEIEKLVASLSGDELACLVPLGREVLDDTTTEEPPAFGS